VVIYLIGSRKTLLLISTQSKIDCLTNLFLIIVRKGWWFWVFFTYYLPELHRNSNQETLNLISCCGLITVESKNNFSWIIGNKMLIFWVNKNQEKVRYIITVRPLLRMLHILLVNFKMEVQILHFIQMKLFSSHLSHIGFHLKTL